jgi:hypothetical protein
MGFCPAGHQDMERETGVQPVISTSGNAVTADNDRNDRQLLALGFVGSFSKSHPYVRGVGCAFVEPAPEHRVVPFFVCHVPARFCSFPAFSLASLNQLLVGYPINRKAHHFVRIRKTELLFDVRSMRLDGFDAEIDLFRDGTCAVSATQHYQDLEFPIG